ncbi:beta-ketoacyl-ACP reductase [Rathayibacter tritici]|uniref:SDR family NAD(P)-dependent oxidoreductase n=1 Tax=Rathayibacter tritici TaxID=33888 RepID=UPI000CE830C8|nr:SDR family NAD(P)-dependent oxidoreductase [Rathayibacter tritici]PPF28049.1 beta-ketoacyl-ACP reductase [Rathayibacter tritici]PPI10692.1 beta-ketoacyl-ACP reductase [Rathayibacter tritici]PPI47031.1 beta-ketoacyl-ACP reductase [Rathayibacter tritici]
MDTKHKSALIVGGSKGIGSAVVRRFLADGWLVAATHRGSGVPQGALGIEADITDRESIQRAVAATLEAHGGIDTLVVSSGITRDGLLLRLSEDDIRAVVETNLLGPIFATQLALKGMLRAKRGSIVLISSTSARVGVVGQTNYTAAKAGLEGFARSFAREYASRGIRMNVVAPGATDTDMMNAVPTPEREAMVAQIPAARLGTPDEIADVVFWVSQSTYMSGATVNAAGGA